MKTLTTFSSEFLNNFESLIFITKMGTDWESQWEILTDKDGNSFTDINDAIIFIRSEGIKGRGIGLATLNQAKQNNAQWDNL